jgi:hypothetical protein
VSEQKLCPYHPQACQAEGKCCHFPNGAFGTNPKVVEMASKTCRYAGHDVSLAAYGKITSTERLARHRNAERPGPAGAAS